MLNQIVIVGRLCKDPEMIVTESNKKKTLITVAVPRSYKNVEGNYDTDYIRCTLWNGIAENTCEYCKKGDVIGVKGRIQTSSYEKEESIVYAMDVIAEKISFLSKSKKADDEE